MTLSHPPPHYFRGGARGKLHCPRPMPGDILLTSPRAEARLLPKGAKAKGIRVKRVKLRKAKAEAEKRGLVARSCARSGRKDVVGEVQGIEMMEACVGGELRSPMCLSSLIFLPGSIG